MNLRSAGWIRPLGGLVLGLGVLAAGCARGKRELPPPKPPEVKVAVPVTERVTDFEEFVGRTEPVHSIDVRARVTGYLDKVDFKEGADVKEGDLLFEIDSRTYKAELERAEASVVQAQAHLERLQSDATRGRAMLARRAISQEEYEKMTGDRSEAEAQLRLARASRDLTKLNLNFTRVTAPMSGRIGRQFIDPGNLVKADDTILTGIVGLDPMYAAFDVDERTVLRLRRLIREGKIASAREKKIPVLLGLADEDDFPLRGVIDFVDNRVDVQTGTLRVRGVFDNKDRFLSPGMFVRVRVPIGDPYPATLVAEKALGSDQGQRFVYVVAADNKVVATKVKVGTLHNGLRVIQEGLGPNDRVVVSGLQRVRPGLEVDPKLVDMPSQPRTDLASSRPPTSTGSTPKR